MDTFINEGPVITILIIQGLLAWALWSLRRLFVRTDEFLQYQHRISSKQQFLKNYLITLERMITELPDSEIMASIAAGVEPLREDIMAVDNRISEVNRLMLRLDRLLSRQEHILLCQQR